MLPFKTMFLIFTRIAFVFVSIIAASPLQAQFSIIKDINPQGDSKVSGMIKAGDLLFFAADDGIHGEELWKSNGTSEGTTLVANINPAPGASSSPRFITAMNNSLFFTADDGSTGQELWKSDGTEDGTHQIKNLFTDDDMQPFFMEIAATNSLIYFVVKNTNITYSLGRSDGTESGTFIVMNGFLYPPTNFTTIDAITYFYTSTLDHGRELWRTNGWPDQTRIVKDIYPGPSWSNIFGLKTFNGTLAFIANDGIHGFETLEVGWFG